MRIKIKDIKISDRIRTDAGDLNELANDIKENGLITPIAVTEDMELLAGWRRLNACKKLGMTDIEANVMSVSDALAKLKIEISENENRKPFTFSEKMRWAEMLKAEYRKQAEENQKRGTSVSSDTQVGRVSDKVAHDVGMGSGTTFARAEYVSKFAPKEMIEALDAEQLSINAAYQALKRENERLQSCNEMLESLDEQSSEQIDSLEMERQRLREENERLKNTMMKESNSDLRKEVVDTRLALRDMEEEKVSAEMALAKKQREYDQLAQSHKTMMENFDRFKKEKTADQKERSHTYEVMRATASMIEKLVSSISSIDTSGWTTEECGSAKSTLSELVEQIDAIAKAVKTNVA